mmetsp:Transcript_6070/g.18304  ORF Transcript_6070/g.18304 Transcript_6070/m.18304 type:complete len:423 (+) Transcript_6070:51-1319(+)
MERGEKGYTSMVGACVAIVRCMVGPAALYMPHGFAEAGLCGGLCVVVAANGLYYAGISRLLRSWRHVAERHEVATVESVAARLGGKWCKRLVEFSIVSLQAGVCVTYFVFVPETLREAWHRISRTSPPSTPLIVAVMVALESSAATVRDVGSLTAPNLAGNVLVSLSLAVIVVVAYARIIDRGTADWRCATTPSSTVVFAGTAIFAFEGGASIVVPVANAVAPHNRDNIPLATFACVVGVATIYVLFASAVYLAFGEDVKVVASRNLSGALDAVVNLLYTLVALISFPLQLLPASQILFGDDAARATPGYDTLPRDDSLAVVVVGKTCCSSAKLKGDAQRVALVFLLALIGLLGRHSLDHLIALLGALSCAPLALVVGPWCHLAIAPDLTTRRIDQAIIALGLVITALTLALTIASWGNASS